MKVFLRILAWFVGLVLPLAWLQMTPFFSSNLVSLIVLPLLAIGIYFLYYAAYDTKRALLFSLIAGGVYTIISVVFWAVLRHLEKKLISIQAVEGSLVTMFSTQPLWTYLLSALLFVAVVLLLWKLQRLNKKN